MTSQSATAVLMVQPTTFGFDSQTAKTNSFQNELALPASDIRHQANEEFKRAVDTLRSHDITVEVYHDKSGLHKPNAVFPNNWLSMWPDGTVYLYSMATESRRVERDKAVIAMLDKSFEVNCIDDESELEDDEKYLESTGVMVFDHLHKVVYGCISPRCNEDLLRRHGRELGYEVVAFHGVDSEGTAIYHTNVMLGVQTNTAVICFEAIRDKRERALVLQKLQETGHEVVDITLAQMTHFCGNVLELQNRQGEYFLAMSQSAYDHFTPNQCHILGKDKQLLPLAIPTIEAVGGGSVRCMLAEIFLPRRLPS